MSNQSTLTKIKRIATVLEHEELDAIECVDKVKCVLNDENIAAIDKILKLKELCKDYGK